MTEMLLGANEQLTSDTGGVGSVLEPDRAARDVRAALERSVVPKLREAFRDALKQAPHPLIAKQSTSETLHRFVDGLVDCLLHGDVEGACACVDEARARGHSLDRIYLDMLMSAAVRISQLLADDLCDSTEGTIAFCNLQIVLRRYTDEFRDEAAHVVTGLRVLLVSPPTTAVAARGLQMCGLLLTSEFFRREGWEAWTERSLESAAFKDAVLTQWFDLVEVLASDDADLDEIATGIKTIRRDAPNPRVGVVACGRVFIEHPEYVRLIGADRSAIDPIALLKHADEIVANPKQNRLS